jgi:NAD(P)-dependent dehydrogenase (short-subunit alcohol dehydrogenase family)
MILSALFVPFVSKNKMNESLFSLDGRVAVVTGGTGVLGGAIAQGLAGTGAKVGILGRRQAQAQATAEALQATGGEAMALTADVLDRQALAMACAVVVERWGRVDILVNAAGGNLPEATVVNDLTFWDLEEEAVNQVVRLNLNGTILPAQVFGAEMARRGRGSIINISSMAAQRPLTRVVGYAAAKAAVDNLTRWLAVELAQKYGPHLRVNAVAPGFFIGRQNRAFLLDEEGNLTPRGQTIINHTPLGRFGEPEELVGVVVWLAGDASRFVTGTIIPVDGGFSAFSGV